jgi:hypothetical protein
MCGVRVGALRRCAFTNPSPHILPNGTVVLAFQAGYCHEPFGFGFELLGVVRADSYLGPYTLITGEPLIPNPLWYAALPTPNLAQQ